MARARPQSSPADCGYARHVRHAGNVRQGPVRCHRSVRRKGFVQVAHGRGQTRALEHPGRRHRLQSEKWRHFHEGRLWRHSTPPRTVPKAPSNCRTTAIRLATVTSGFGRWTVPTISAPPRGPSNPEQCSRKKGSATVPPTLPRAMNVIRHTDKGFAATIRSLTTQSSLFDPTIEERTRAILQDVLTRGDAALRELTERCGGAELTADQLAVPKGEWLSVR